MYFPVREEGSQFEGRPFPIEGRGRGGGGEGERRRTQGCGWVQVAKIRFLLA